MTYKSLLMLQDATNKEVILTLLHHAFLLRSLQAIRGASPEGPAANQLSMITNKNAGEK